MHRRTFLKLSLTSLLWAPAAIVNGEQLEPVSQQEDDHSEKKSHNISSIDVPDEQLKDYLSKVRNPDSPHPDDIFLDEKQQITLSSVIERLDRVAQHVGLGHFSSLGFEEALTIGQRSPSVGIFTKSELDFLEMVYHRDARDYGFLGPKRAVAINHVIKESDTIKIPQSGNYLFKGESVEKYMRIKKDLGDEVILTSGIRGIMKQFLLFLNKTLRHNGNLSLASRSLAPPGYSYHATGDFDIGQKGLGEANFSELFMTTAVFKRLSEQGFVDYRYWRDNMLGVRFEPWHIKL